MKQLSSFAGQNWTIVPVARAPRLPRPGPVGNPLPDVHDIDIDITPQTTDLPYPSNQLWQLTLTGVVFCDVQGTGESAWNQETVQFMPDVDPALRYAASTIGASTGGNALNFDADLWAPHVTPATTFNAHVANNSGHGVDAWRPAPFGVATDVFGVQRNHLFSGVRADVVVRDGDAIVHRLAYHITLVGRLTLHEVIIT